MTLRTIIRDGGCLSPEAWAELATRQLIEIAETAPEPLKAQAHAFRDAAFGLIAHVLRQAIAERRLVDAHLAEAAGHGDLATLIRRS